MNKIILSVGSNKGNRENNIKKAVTLLENKFHKKMNKSPVYETPPLYYDGVENFYNCCVIFESDLEPREIFVRTARIERDMGRIREAANAPRIIDIDIIFIDNLIIAEDDLIIPHQDMHNRKFVLKPLSDIQPGFEHPVMNLSVRTLLDECEDESNIKKIKDFWK